MTRHHQKRKTACKHFKKFEKITEDHHLAFKRIINVLKQDKQFVEFLQPVDYEADPALCDYPELIKQPMDISTLEKKLIDSSYKFLSEVDYDFHLIWNNCMIFNRDDSYIYKCAKKMQIKTNKLFKEYFDKDSKEQQKKIKRNTKSSQTTKTTKKKSILHKTQMKTKQNLSHSQGEYDSTDETYSSNSETPLENSDLAGKCMSLNKYGQKRFLEIAICECPNAVIEHEDNFQIKAEMLNQCAVDRINQLLDNPNFIKGGNLSK